jgi:hypothetical protein
MYRTFITKFVSFCAFFSTSIFLWRRQQLVCVLFSLPHFFFLFLLLVVSFLHWQDLLPLVLFCYICVLFLLLEQFLKHLVLFCRLPWSLLPELCCIVALLPQERLLTPIFLEFLHVKVSFLWSYYSHIRGTLWHLQKFLRYNLYVKCYSVEDKQSWLFKLPFLDYLYMLHHFLLAYKSQS